MARIMKKNVNAEELSVTFTFADGRSFVAKLENYSNEIIDRLALHGMAQKLGDSCAGKDDSEWLATIEALDKQLRNGDWGAERNGTALEVKLDDAMERLAKYIASSDEEKRIAAGFGINRTMLEKDVKRIEKMIAKRDEKK
jgi:hypothetical protein